MATLFTVMFVHRVMWKVKNVGTTILLVFIPQAMQEVPSWLEEYSKSSMPGAGYADVGAKFGGRDIRKNQPRVWVSFCADIKCYITMLVYIAKQWINSLKKGLILSTCVIIQGYCNVETLTNHFNMFYFPCIDLIKFVWFDVNCVFKWISK